jgi:hypothetical protein
MDRPKPFMHMIGGEQIGYSGEFVQQAIFETKQWRRSYNGGLGEDISHNSLTSCLNHVSLSSFPDKETVFSTFVL